MEKSGLFLQIEDLDEKYQEYASIIGIENFLKLSDEYGGTPIYIPQRAELEKLKKYNEIKKEYDGTNIKALAHKYGVSESKVYAIVRQQIAKRKSPVLEGQINMQDFME